MYATVQTSPLFSITLSMISFFVLQPWGMVVFRSRVSPTLPTNTEVSPDGNNRNACR